MGLVMLVDNIAFAYRTFAASLVIILVILAIAVSIVPSFHGHKN